VFSGVRLWWLVGGLATALVVGCVWLLWPSAPPPRAQQYLAFNACLLTGNDGVTGAAAPVWSGMQDASLKTRAKVEFLPVFGEASKANALPYLASLVQRHCDVILAVGSAQIAAVSADAPARPRVHFVVVGGQVSAPNVVSLDASSPEQVRRQVATEVMAAVKSSSRG
jgi:basic membrane lipoprotein Med (substrate-binding protein (PBP1-ABC) superfamily)